VTRARRPAAQQRAELLLPRRGAALLRRRRRAARDLAANDFKYWELMRRACARGSRSSTTAAASRAPGPTPSRRTGASSPRRCTTNTAVQARRRAAEQPQQCQVQAADRDLAAHAHGLANWLGPIHRAQPGAGRIDTVAKLLYLVHRMPYPPNKGDKVRSYHLLKHLAARHQVFLGTFVDDPDDLQHLPPLRGLCADVCAWRAAAPAQRQAAQPGRPADRRSADPALLPQMPPAGWVAQTVARSAIDATPWCSLRRWRSMHWRSLGCRCWPTSVDVDSAKWTQYADRHAWPMSWLYRREGQRLLAYERTWWRAQRASFFVTDKEVACLAAWRLEAGPGAGRGQRRGRRVLRARCRAAIAVCRGRAAAGVHRRHGLLAQCRCRVLVRRARCCRCCASAGRLLRCTSSAAAPRPRCRRWPASGVRHRHGARRAPLSAACGGGGGAAAPGARHAEQGAGGHGHGAAGGSAATRWARRHANVCLITTAGRRT
jgi:hypothetical protein